MADSTDSHAEKKSCKSQGDAADPPKTAVYKNQRLTCHLECRDLGQGLYRHVGENEQLLFVNGANESKSRTLLLESFC